MDHLPLIPGSPYEHLPVPYLCTAEYPYEYDYKRWNMFHHRNGWDVGQFPLRNFQYEGHEDPQRAAAFLQTWLFFGFLAEMLGARIAMEDFIVEREGQKFVTTTKLPQYISEWQDRVDLLSSKEKEIEAARVD